MMWVCRAGQGEKMYSDFVENSMIFIAWEGYKTDLNSISTRDEFRKLVQDEKNPEARTTVSNWAGQLYSFSKQMEINDYVLLPGPHSHFYTLAKIKGNYQYDEEAKFHHCRKIEIIKEKIERDRFPQDIIYSLGAYRTIFKTKHEEKIIEIIENS